jgi:hypothetical protein
MPKTDHTCHQKSNQSREKAHLKHKYNEHLFPWRRVLTISKIKKKFLQSESVTDLQPKNYIRQAFNISCQLVFGEDGRADQVLVEANITAVIYDESLRKSSSSY